MASWMVTVLLVGALVVAIRSRVVRVIGHALVVVALCVVMLTLLHLVRW